MSSISHVSDRETVLVPPRGELYSKLTTSIFVRSAMSFCAKSHARKVQSEAIREECDVHALSRGALIRSFRHYSENKRELRRRRVPFREGRYRQRNARDEAYGLHDEISLVVEVSPSSVAKEWRGKIVD